MTDSAPNEKPEKKKLPVRDWEGAVDKQIREAIARGEFDNLSGKGKPLDLDINPFVPEEMREAYRILQNAGVAPFWIEQDKQIRVEKAALAKMLEDQARWQRERAAKAKSLAPEQIIAEHEYLTRSRAQVIARFRDRAVALNKIIDAFNLQAPNNQLHHARILIQQEIEKFLEACKE
jgi:hypothetical protein